MSSNAGSIHISPFIMTTSAFTPPTTNPSFPSATTKQQCPQHQCLPKRCNPTAKSSLSSTPTPGRVIAAAAATALIALTSISPAFAATISAERCTSGEGPGCELAASESPAIREMLERSKANKEKNDKRTLEEYWERGYKPYFSYGYNKELVKDDDGKWSLQDPNDLQSKIERRIIDFVKKQKGN